MEIIGVYLSKLLSLIDNGKFFIIPMKWIYKILSVLIFIVPIIVLYKIIQLFDTGIFEYMGGWNKFVAVVVCVLFFVSVLALAYVNFRFWQSRCKKIDHVVKVGDQVVAVPLYSNLLQNIGEVWGINIAIVGPVFYFLAFLFVVLTGTDVMSWGSRDNYLQLVIIGLIMFVLFSAASIISGFLVVLIFRFVAESIRLVAQIANDTRDMGDILRSATMIEKPASAEEAEVELGEES